MARRKRTRERVGQDKKEVKSLHRDATEALRIRPEIHRRILRFLNAARRPEDLVVPANQGIQVMPDRPIFRGPDVHEPSGPRGKAVLDIKSAKAVIDWREENSPVYGFIDIRQLLNIEGLWEFLHHLILCFGPAFYGQFDSPFDIPSGYDRPVHGALVHTGKVLFFGLPNGNNTFLWDPSKAGPSAFNFPNNQPTDSIFCSGHSFLSDGKLLVVGGGGDGTVTGHHNHGWKFDPGNETWARTAGDMAYSRWYPTLVTMGDAPGRVLVVSGIDGIVPQMEMYLESSDRFERVWGPGGPGDTSANREFPQL
jgi:hypothetical protein